MDNSGSIQELVLRFVIDFSKILQSIKVYPPSHPVVQKGIIEATRLAEEILIHIPQVSVGVKDGVLIVEDTPFKESYANLHPFLQILERKNIDSFILKKGVSEKEISAFVRLISAKDEDVLTEGRIRPDLLKGFNNIKINEIQYRRIRGEEEVGKGEGKRGGTSPKTVWDEPEIVNALLGGKDAESPAFRHHLAGLMTKGPQAAAQLLEKALWRLNTDKERKESASSCLERMGQALASSSDKGIVELKEVLRQLILTMGPHTQRILWGKKMENPDEVDVDNILLGFSSQAKATILKNEVIKKDITDEDLKSVIQSLVSTEAELAGLSEFISKEIGRLGLPLDQVKTALTKFFVSTQSFLRPTPPVTGCKVYIAEEDLSTGQEYERLLTDAKYQVVTCADGEELRLRIRKEKPEIVIMGIRLHGVTGLEIISELQRDKVPLPLIVSTSFSAFETAFEVKTYPKLRFFLKPVSPKGLLKAVQELTWRPDEGVLKEDLTRAKKIQEGLLPKELPELSGYDIYAHYRACSDVGGDYYDIIPIDDKRLGLVIADVSGKGVSGAMVMVMVRSILRTVAERGLSARDVIIETNRLLAKDLQGGMFVTAMYVVLDVEKGEVSICRAGHNPLILWNKDSQSITSLAPSGMALGLSDDSQFFTENLIEERLTLSYGDRISIYTDGITEAMNANQEEFGEERLSRLIRDYADTSSRELTTKIIEEVESHQGQVSQSDDITFLTLSKR